MPYCTVEELKHLSAAREQTYALVGRAFSKEADESFWQMVERTATSFGSKDSPASEGFARLARYVTAHDEPPLADLAVDYAATFLGIGPRHDGAFPYESVYTSEEKLLRQDAFDEMVAVLHRERIASALDMVSDEDHVSTEFALLSRYAHKVSLLLDAGEIDNAWLVEKQRIRFLQDHAMRWIPDFCRDVERFAETEFYRAFACIASEFLTMDCAVSIEEAIETAVEVGAA